MIENNLSRGLITEATGLNFPENAATEADNVVFDSSGAVLRREGFDVLDASNPVDPEPGLVQTFLWETAGDNNERPLVVLRTGLIIRFFDPTNPESVTSNPLVTEISLRTYQAQQAESLPYTPCSFASGAGYLFIANQFCDTIVVDVNDSGELSVSSAQIMVRDFEGVQSMGGVWPFYSPIEDGENPTNLTSSHHYNLKNQGWNQNVRIGSSNNEVTSSGSGSGGLFS